MRRSVLILALTLAFAAPQDPHWRIIGPGGGGSMFHPTVSPHDSRVVVLTCDMTGNYITYDGGETWRALREGLPQENAFIGVMRQAMATDRLEPAGVYFGSSSGSLFASADEGESWHCLAEHLPAISSVETLVVDD